jgi:hypothetical protein
MFWILCETLRRCLKNIILSLLTLWLISLTIHKKHIFIYYITVSSHIRNVWYIWKVLQLVLYIINFFPKSFQFNTRIYCEIFCLYIVFIQWNKFVVDYIESSTYVLLILIFWFWNILLISSSIAVLQTLLFNAEISSSLSFSSIWTAMVWSINPFDISTWNQLQ